LGSIPASSATAGLVKTARSASEKAGCYAAIGEWVAPPGRWPALAVETWQNLRDIVFTGQGRRDTARVN
jgi:hypothetical protein